MNANEKKAAMPDLPDDARRAIDGEIEAGLVRFRQGGAEARMMEAARAAARSLDAAEGERSAPSPRPFLRRWAPAYGAALLAAAIAGGYFLFKPAPAGNGEQTLRAALESTPGLRTLERALADPLYTFVPSVSAEAPILRSLARAAAVSAQGQGDIAAPPVLVPKYDLGKKIKILIDDRPIERALATIKFRTGELEP